mmetsp:Transcript_17517/g.27335  ORF Transcript_17517/g.27335 Transcript_17517/m.27335 type:complete len:250 (-) Transcript_17517:833-1582(-)|eukprot:CAMPEP_0203757394 /NCGR_PEP_ID=MMETSP0098-20131031/10478_1 /ASSEMBLY_ACC=CAM_ASM_000208 /TAXON_ID=96639 /ORGANISM=" , Strain NY0313808BC1" /LENGTH=249 /DNA_ID=CAMNT_0050649603 /DNA_START=550 /DNA_END=1299 /DNA_ORIENTATION=-
MSREKSWFRPPVLGKDPDAAESSRKKEDSFVDQGGDEYYIPDEDSEQDEEMRDSVPVPPNFPVESSQQQNQLPIQLDDEEGKTVRSNEDEKWDNNLKKLREAENEEQKLFAEKFTEMLEERGVMPYSQWPNWSKKVLHDDRCKNVHPEYRAKIFRTYTKSLVGKGTYLRKKRILACRDFLREFASSGSKERNMIVDCRSDVEELLRQLSKHRDSKDNQLKSKDLARRLVQYILALPEKDRARVLEGVRE